MKNLKIWSLAGLFLVIIFLFDIGLVVVAIIKNNDLYVAYAILVSCLQLYVYEKLKLSRFVFDRKLVEICDIKSAEPPGHQNSIHCKINLN